MKRTLVLSWIPALFTVVLLIASATASANSFADTYGYSARGISMGNAMTATVNDWSSVYYNMAGLGKTNHLRIKHVSTEEGVEDSEDFYPNQMALVFIYTAPQFNINIDRRDKAGNVLTTNAAKDLDFSALVLGLTIDLNKVIKFPKVVSSARFGMGMGVAGAGYASKVEDVDIRSHDFLRYGREAQRAVIVTGLGFGFLDDSFGFGIGANVSFHGEAKSMLSNVDIGPDEQTPYTQSKMDLKVAPSVVAGFYGHLEKIGGSKIGLDMGLSYKQESYLEIYPFVVRNITRAGGIDMTVDLSVFDYYTPHSISAGLAVKLGKLTLSGQVDYEMWSKFRVSTTMQNVFSQMQTDTSDKKYAIPTFRDIVVPRIGIAAKILENLELLGGYYYQQSFVPDEAVRGIFNFLDNNRHVVSFGLKIGLHKLPMFGGPTDIILGCQFHILEDRTVEKPNDMVNGSENTYNPRYSYGGWNPTASLEIAMKL